MGKNKFSLAVFDLDGTLVNTLADLANCMNRALLDCGFAPHEQERYKIFVGNGVTRLVSRALPESARDEKTVSETAARFNDYYRAGYLERSLPYEGVPQAIRCLASFGVSLGVYSNKPHEFTQSMVSALFDVTFALVLGAREGYEKKPSPEPIFEIMRKAGVTPADTIYFGDSGVDMQTGKNAGVMSIGCTWGFRSESELLEHGANAIIRSPGEIVGTILKKNLENT